MCLFPRFIKNKRYTSYTVKRKGHRTQIACDDFRKLYVPIGCGHCYECRKQKAQQWRVRLMEELKVQPCAQFVTFTFSNEALKKLMKQADTNDDNTVATKATRLFLERYRKKYKKSLRHWFITELGHENTERIHLHGIIFPQIPMTNNELSQIWSYGRTDIGEYCNERTINYIVKYVTKIDTDHKKYQPKILCSAGLGENFVHTEGAQLTYKYKPKNTAEFYRLKDGNKVALPIYYRNKLFTQKERDKLWTERLDKNEIFVNGIRIRRTNTDAGQRTYYQTLADAQKWNNYLGYGNTSDEWKPETYKITWKMLQRAKGGQ